MPTKTTGDTIRVPDLGTADREQMFKLLSGHYLGVTSEAFERDLAAKEHVILLRSGDGEIVGFSTQVRFRMTLPDRTVVAVFSGDTIVSEQHRGTFETARQICRYFRSALSDYPGEEVYWVLICKGWRTYRVLRLFFKEALTMIFTGADATGFEEDARLTAMWLWTLKTDDQKSEVRGQETEEDQAEEEEGGGKKGGGGFVLEFDAARKIAQGLGAHLEDLASLVAVGRRLVQPTLRGALLGLEIGTNQGTLPVEAGRFGRTPHIALSGPFLALRASDCNGWPRRWVPGGRRDWCPGRTCRIPPHRFSQWN